MHPADRRPRQDVVELQGEDLLPDPIERLGRVAGRRRAATGHRRPQFRLPQQHLAATVALFRPGLRRVGAAVHLEVQLADPHRGIRVLRDGGVEELRRRFHRDRREPFDVPHPSVALQHVGRRSPAPVAVTEQQHRPGGPALLGELALGLGQLGRLDRCAVGVGRGEVREDPTPVDALPQEAVVREAVGAVPGHLLGEEPIATSQPEQLGERGRITEHVGYPHLPARHAEVLGEEALTVQELPRHRLAAGHVPVRFDPTPPDRDPLAPFDRIDDVGEHGRVVLPHPVVLHRLRTREPELRVVLRQSEGVGERPGDLAHRLPHRPQPGRVDVGVADRRQPVGRRHRGTGQHLGELVPGRRRGPDDIVEVESVEAGLEGSEDLPVPLAVPRKFVHQADEHPKVVVQVRHVAIDHREVDGAHDVQRVPAGGVPIAVGSGGRAPHERVGGSFDEESHLLASVGRIGHPYDVIGRVQAPLGLPLPQRPPPPDHALGHEPRSGVVEPEVEDRLDGLARPRGRDLAGEPEPDGPPWPAPRRSRSRRHPVVGARRDVHGDGLAHRAVVAVGNGPHLRVHGEPRSPDRRTYVLATHACQTSFDDVSFGVHGSGASGLRSAVRSAVSQPAGPTRSPTAPGARGRGRRARRWRGCNRPRPGPHRPPPSPPEWCAAPGP